MNALVTTGHDTFDYIVTGAGCVGDPVHFLRSRETASNMILEDARMSA